MWKFYFIIIVIVIAIGVPIYFISRISELRDKLMLFDYIQRENSRLKTENTALKKENNNLKNKNSDLKSENEASRGSNAKLEKVGQSHTNISNLTSNSIFSNIEMHEETNEEYKWERFEKVLKIYIEYYNKSIEILKTSVLYSKATNVELLAFMYSMLEFFAFYMKVNSEYIQKTFAYFAQKNTTESEMAKLNSIIDERIALYNYIAEGVIQPRCDWCIGGLNSFKKTFSSASENPLAHCSAAFFDLFVNPSCSKSVSDFKTAPKRYDIDVTEFSKILTLYVAFFENILQLAEVPKI